MKNLNIAACLLILMTSAVSYKCKKDTTDSFCTRERQTYSSFSERDGIVGYSDVNKRYLILFVVSDSNNIDESIAGFPCRLDKELQIVGKKVSLSGILKKFNSDENIAPEIGGEHCYFLELSNIKPKQ